jgi:prolyl-tRNA editing enzyme YbaK/EbsC (Cys-tRNA(Pro) deacylase)
MVDEPLGAREDPIDATAAERARAAIAATGIPFEVTHHGHVDSLEQAAAARGLEPGRLLKSMVVRRADDDFLFVLVPGGRAISWPKLRALLGVSRLSMPSADVALAVTGYPRGTITPLGSLRAWPVIADSAMPSGPVSIGGGASGTAFTVDSADLVRALAAQVADVTDSEAAAT